MTRKTTTCVECHGQMQTVELVPGWCDSCFFTPDRIRAVRRLRFQARRRSHVDA